MCNWFRDKSRDKICAGLQSLGVNARMAARGSGDSLGIIDIDDEPISWVDVRKVVTQHAGGSGYGGGGSSTTYYTDYGVRVAYRPPVTTIRSVRRKRFPLVGKVVDAEWSANGVDRTGLVAGVLQRLREDGQVREAIMATRDVEITGHSSFWVITTQTREVPTRQAWDCYPAIARHLIAAEGPTGATQWDRIEV